MVHRQVQNICSQTGPTTDPIRAQLLKISMKGKVKRTNNSTIQDPFLSLISSAGQVSKT